MSRIVGGVSTKQLAVKFGGVRVPGNTASGSQHLLSAGCILVALTEDLPQKRRPNGNARINQTLMLGNLNRVKV